MTLVSTLYGGNYLIPTFVILIEQKGEGEGREREWGGGVDGGEMEIYLLSNFDPDSFKPN
jgi:hypothetical protein